MGFDEMFDLTAVVLVTFCFLTYAQSVCLIFNAGVYGRNFTVERLNVGAGVPIRSTRNGASSRKGCILNGQITKASNKQMRPSPRPVTYLQGPPNNAKQLKLRFRVGGLREEREIPVVGRRRTWLQICARVAQQ